MFFANEKVKVKSFEEICNFFQKQNLFDTEIASVQVPNALYGTSVFNSNMAKLCGKTFKIKKVKRGEGKKRDCVFLENVSDYYFIEDWLEHIDKDQKGNYLLDFGL